MNLLHIATIRLIIPAFFLCLLILSIPAQAQTEVGPDAVWRPTSNQLAELDACSGNPNCSPALVMGEQGAPAAAIEFVRSRSSFEFLASFEELGAVDLGQIYLPRTNYLRRFEMLNGNPPIVASDSIGFPDMSAIPQYASLLARYPNLTLWPVAMSVEGGSRDGGGQRFVASYPLVDGCHACENLGTGQVAFDFDAAGNYLGITHLGLLADEPTPAPPVLDPDHPLRQIAYVDPSAASQPGSGDIWLIDEAGGNRQQITDSGADCCLAWSPDGSLLYFIRNAKTKDDLSTPSSGVIMAYDFRLGQERTIPTPDVNISDSLALSPDGRSLAFSTSDWVDVETWGDVHKGCLYVLDTGTGEGSLVDCEAPGAIYSIAYATTGAIATEVGFWEGSRIAFYDSSGSPRRYDDRICCSDPRYAPNGTSLFTNGSGYGTMSSSLIYYESLSAAPVVLIEVPNEQGWVGNHHVSPDGRSLVYAHNGQIEIMDLGTRATTMVGIFGFNPAWRPDYADAAVDLDPLLDRKTAVFEQLETTGYETSAGVLYPEPIAAFDETAARALVDKLRAADPATITPEQAAAFERLVMQEEALAALLDDYAILAGDQADVAVDLAGMTSGSFILAAKAKSNIAAAIGDLLSKALEDFIKLLLRFIDDEDLREGMSDSIGLAVTLLDVYADNTLDADDVTAMAEEFMERTQDDGVRALAFGKLLPGLVAATQPAVDRGVRSASGAGEPRWAADGPTEAAQIGLDGLTTQSSLMRELAHDVYTNSLGRGRDVNEFLKDIVDLALLGTKNPIGLIFSIQTRLQQILIDTAATSVLSGAMTCTRDAAVSSGEFAFQPDRPVFGCEVPVPLDLGDFFRRLLTEKDREKRHVGRLAAPRQSGVPEFDAALAEYRAAVAALRDALGADGAGAVRARVDELLVAAETLNDEAMPVMARLDPASARADAAAAESAMALGTAVTFVRLDALFALLAADAWLADPAAADTAAFNDVLLEAEENVNLLDRVAAQVSLPAAPDAALPVVDAPAQVSAVAGEETQIPVQVLNAGGQPFAGARLALEVDGEIVVDMALPDLAPGQMTEQLLAYTPLEPGRARLTARGVAGDLGDWRTLMLVAKPPAEAAGETNPMIDGAAADEADPAMGLNGAQPILLGVMIISGAVFVLGLGVLLLRGRRKP